jgi:hypothetical protein
MRCAEAAQQMCSAVSGVSEQTALVIPADWKRFSAGEPRAGECNGLSPLKDRSDNVWRQPAKPGELCKVVSCKSARFSYFIERPCACSSNGFASGMGIGDKTKQTFVGAG